MSKKPVPDTKYTTTKGKADAGPLGQSRQSVGESSAVYSPPNSPIIIGRASFAGINSIEGLQMSADMKKDFEALDAAGLNPEQRRKFLAAKYGS